MLYVDGVVAGSGSAPSGSTSNTSPFRIGADSGCCDERNFNGTLDEIRVYNRALSANEIAALYDFGRDDKVGVGMDDTLALGLGGYWKLDEGTGTSTTDSSTNGNTGTLSGSPAWATGQIGASIDFDGADDYVTVPDAPSLDLGSGDLTVTAWIKATANRADWRDIAEKVAPATYTGFFFQINANSNVNCDIGTEAVGGGSILFNENDSAVLSCGSQVVDDGAWHHVTFVRNGTQRTIYVDAAVDMAGTNGSVPNLNNAEALTIGRLSVAPIGQYFDGQIDEVRIYSRALSIDEVWRLYRETAPTGTDTGLKGYWSFNGRDMAGTTAYDRSGSGNNGTLTNGPTLTQGKIGQALSFDGSDDYVDAGDINALDGASTFTMSAWIKQNSLLEGRSVVSKYTNSFPHVSWGTSGGGEPDRMGMLISGANYGTVSTDVHQAEVWEHWVWVFDGTQTGNSNRLKAYLNGAEQTLSFGGTIPATTNSTAAAVAIGADSGGDGSAEWNGSIDEVRLYSRVLSANEIAALYNAGR
jgi:hypothetical protein